jgi:hypothetical protein
LGVFAQGGGIGTSVEQFVEISVRLGMRQLIGGVLAEGSSGFWALSPSSDREFDTEKGKNRRSEVLKSLK